ncbi:hypothetical protein ACJIZ3_016744 [Penstemon smallii]|uniref:Uncharacterized protein n=1 Tax=Penstemon smallii TaxID=265156 RepID=A0ABD3STK6_9LAMI
MMQLLSVEIKFNSVMERNKEFRRATVDCINGLPRRRQRITTLRDSPEDERQMELQETLRLRDRERLQKKDRDRNREFLKRRRVDRQHRIRNGGGGGESYGENESTGSSDEEYYEKDEETLKIHQPNRRSVRTLRTSPGHRGAADEIIGVPVPRRARSSLTKRLHDYWSSGGDGFTEDLKNKKIVEPVTRIFYSASNSRPCSVIQDDIEIEVAEALFDLMKQNQSSKKLDRDSRENTVDNKLRIIKDEVGGAENSAFSIQNEQSIRVDAETITVDSIEEVKKEKRIEKEKFQDDSTRELLSGNGFLSKGKVASPKESDSPSRVKVNACDIQDQTVTKADYEAVVVETKKETKLEIDLMALPPFPSSPERDLLVDMTPDPKAMAKHGQEKGETNLKEKIGAVCNQLPNLDVSLVSEEGNKPRQPGRKEQKNQFLLAAPTSLSPFPMPTNGSTGVLPHLGYMRSIQPGLPIDGSARSSLAVQPPQFKSSQPRSKRCSTHQYIAHNIHYHQQLIKKSLVSGPTGASHLYETRPLNLNSMSLTQKFVPGNPLIEHLQVEQNFATVSVGGGRDKKSDVAAALNTSASNKLVPQQAIHQAPANNILHCPAFYFPLGGIASLPSNLPGKEASVNFNHLKLPPNEAAPYMAIFPKNGGPIPISQAPTLPVFSSSFYSSQSQQQLSLPHSLVQSVSQNTSTSNSLSSHKPPTSTKISDNPKPMNFTMIPHGTTSDLQNGPKGRELIPQAYAMSFGSNASTNPAFSFSSSSPPIFHMLPDIAQNGYQMARQSNFQTSEGKSATRFSNLDNELKGILGKSPDSSAVSVTIPNFQQHLHQEQLIQLQKHHMQQMNNNAVFTRFDTPQWVNLSRTAAAPELKSSQGGQTRVPFGNSSFHGQHRNSSISRNRVGSPRNASAVGSKTLALPMSSQQADDSSSNGPTCQKSSPDCRRNVPSILITCPPTQLSELKY